MLEQHTHIRAHKHAHIQIMIDKKISTHTVLRLKRQIDRHVCRHANRQLTDIHDRPKQVD